MKKGFTLIELLIVMVIVGVLVAVALPQYNRSVERGRVLEGIATVRSVADYMNAQYILRDFNYPSNPSTANMDVLENKYFGSPQITGTGSITISIARDGSSGWSYQLYAVISGGEITGSGCNGDDCALLGIPESGIF